MEIPQNFPNNTDWLLISGNDISTFNQEMLHESLFNNIKHLDISGNKLENISNKFIDFFTNSRSRLSFLDISNNNLTTLPRNIQNISSLETLRLSENSLKCSCENMWMKDWLNRTDIIHDSTNISCQMPSRKEILMMDMNPEDLNCPSLESPKNTKHNLWKIPGYILFSFFPFYIGLKI